MKRSMLCLAVLLAVSASRAHAGHMFDEGASPDPPVALLPQQGVEVTMEDIFDDTADGSFFIRLQFNLDFTGLVEDEWSTGDILRFTMNGFSLLIDFDNLLSNQTTVGGFQVEAVIESGDLGFTEYDDQVFTTNTFTLELLAGDGVRFDGFTLADRIGGTNALNSAQFAGLGGVFAVPEPSTLLLLNIGFLLALSAHTASAARRHSDDPQTG